MILVTGADGVVGSYFKEIEETFPEPLDYTDIDTLDVCKTEAVLQRVGEGGYSAVIHLAAETDVDLCERDPGHAYRTNAIGTYNIALACHRHQVLMVYVSTGAVFGRDGRFGTYSEFDDPCPVNFYGRSKLEGEKFIERLLDRYYIVRAGWMIGGGKKEKKFIAKIMNLIKERDTIQAVTDKVGTITFARELVAGIRELMKTGYYGTYHMGNPGPVTRYDIASELASFLERPVKIEPVNSAYFPLPAPRGNSEALENLKLEFLGLNLMSPWRETLHQYLSELVS